MFIITGVYLSGMESSITEELTEELTHESASQCYRELNDNAEIEFNMREIRKISVTDHAVYVYFKDYTATPWKIVRSGQ